MRKLLTLILCVVAMPMLADGKYFGGDISLLPSYVSHGAKYLATDGTPYRSGYTEQNDRDTAAKVIYGAYISDNLDKFCRNAYGL